MKNKIQQISKIFLLIGITAIFSGCNPNNPPPNSSTLLQWNVTIGGQNFSWQGDYPNSMSGGSATASGSGAQAAFGIVCFDSSPSFMATFALPTYGLGNFTLNSSNYSATNMMGINQNGSINYATAWGGSIIVNVTQFPSAINGIIKGTFNGTIGKSPALGGGTTTISGSFDVLRAD
jgi:hypothetical protein